MQNPSMLGVFDRIRIMQQNGAVVSLLRLLQNTIGFESTDPRDQIYAVLGLAKDSDRQAIPIDYKKDVKQLYIDVTKHIIQSERSLEIIGSLTISPGRDLPSWVPDYAPGPRRIRNPLSRDHLASGDVPLDVQFIRDVERGLDVLAVRGVMFDTISEIERTIDVDTVQSLALTCLKKKIPTTDPRCHLSRRAAIWRTCIADRGLRGSVPASTKFMTMHEILASHREIDTGPTTEVIETLIITHQESEMERFVKPFKENMEYAALHRRLFSTETGFIGLCPDSARVGDLVVVLFGGHIPYVLRETDKKPGAQTLVGEAFLHGIMYGELLKLHRKAGDESIRTEQFLII